MLLNLLIILCRIIAINRKQSLRLNFDSSRYKYSTRHNLISKQLSDLQTKVEKYLQSAMTAGNLILVQEPNIINSCQT